MATLQGDALQTAVTVVGECTINSETSLLTALSVPVAPVVDTGDVDKITNHLFCMLTDAEWFSGWNCNPAYHIEKIREYIVETNTTNALVCVGLLNHAERVMVRCRARRSLLLTTV